jgi:hypothetical protein
VIAPNPLIFSKIFSHSSFLFPRESSRIANGLVESGNDGRAVRTRYRSRRGAIAFRHVGGDGTVAFGAQQHQRNVPSSPNAFGRFGDNATIIANERRRPIRVAQNWMASSERAFHW